MTVTDPVRQPTHWLSNNQAVAPADNAYVFALVESKLLSVVLGELQHPGQEQNKVINALLTASSLKKGRSAIFNE